MNLLVPIWRVRLLPTVSAPFDVIRAACGRNKLLALFLSHLLPVFKLYVSEDPTVHEGESSKKSYFPVIFADYSISRIRHLGPEEQRVFRIAIVHPGLVRNCVSHPPTTETCFASKSNVTIEHLSIIEGAISHP